MRRISVVVVVVVEVVVDVVVVVCAGAMTSLLPMTGRVVAGFAVWAALISLRN